MNLNQTTHDTALEDHPNRGARKLTEYGNGFEELGIAPNLMREIRKLRFKQPTPVQEKSIPAGIQGDDIIAIAQTGSGKTIGFGIPMLQRLAKAKKGAGLVLVPTRELAIQVDEAIRAISRTSHVRTAVVIGGASMALQRKALKKTPRIIIATPGRLMDHIERRSVNLSNIEILVLDEADRMLDMGFLNDIRKIIKSVPDRRQTMLFSATMPKEIEAIAEKLMENPTRVEIDRSGVTPAEVSQEMFFIDNRDKSRLLALQLKQCSGPVLVFTRTKRMASKLTLRVKNMGFAAAEIHSNRSQGQRRNALEGFKRGRYQILVATDIAARGIDVSGIKLVVNYDMPANSEDYVHRIGRTGRAGMTGHAISFATAEQKGSIRALERFMKTRLPVSEIPVLPSQKALMRDVVRMDQQSKFSSDEEFFRRKSSKDRSAKRRSFRRNDSNGSEIKWNESKKRDTKRKDSNRPDSKGKVSKLQNVHQTFFNPIDSANDDSAGPGFKKRRSPKKKSVGQGSRRKRRTRRR